MHASAEVRCLVMVYCKRVFELQVSSFAYYKVCFK